MNKTVQRTMSLLLFLGLLWGWQPGLVQAAEGDLTLQASKNPVDGNERFTISVMVEAPDDLYGVQLSLTYDATQLTVLNVSAGSAWPVGDTFVARATASGGGTDTESIEFAATLKSDGATIDDGELVSILVEAANPVAQTTTTIGAGSSLALLFSDAAGQSLAATPPGDLTITINPAPVITGVVTLQSPGTGRQATVEGVNISGQDSQLVGSGVQFFLSLPTTAGVIGPYQLTASADCHLSAAKENVPSPSSGHTVTLIAGDVNGDNRINIQDLAVMGNLFGQAPGDQVCADLDESGTVNILDLSRAASNYGEEGPLDW